MVSGIAVQKAAFYHKVLEKFPFRLEPDSRHRSLAAFAESLLGSEGGEFVGLTDVVLGYDSAAEYEAGSVFLGATIGRFANRIGGARFSLGGREYLLAKNDGENCLHGGAGFHKKYWSGRYTDGGVQLRLESPDGDQGFPGRL
ncbi:MAG: galactose-1-epimerase, partial [Bacteroidales bacterium]|nr:galactose-1-epimerase [Bacteroidales bacterium]